MLPGNGWPPARKESGPRENAFRLRRKELDLPFPVSPPGKAGAGGFPPRRKHAATPAKTAGTRRCCRLPPQEGLPPPCVSPAPRSECSELCDVKRTDH